ncbi:hypothetical protein GV794_23985 [Nocardia cyriacigeorgica]|uniref:Uncharacterized protein n=1 Tax=Nocardia cyriacigeorgica TaxID=135487 RepID=A0ABX0CS44_9NOCA|nr:hypothetical protein [Nocardia cyriacigeorgica]NEW58677.1 hypothetical protein [Nocardia cyriacigeorgica]
MLERELQDFVEDLISRGSLIELITGWDDVKAIAADQRHRGEHLLILDDLVLHRAAESALVVKDRIGELVPVANSRSSISLDRSQALFTDLLYVSPRTGTVVVFELKRSRSVARETATELLAYEQELRNHLHFAARTDICFVVVSTDYSPLLDHSLLSLAAWHGLRILCLKVGSDKQLQVHLPEAWTSLGQALIPAQHIDTTTLTFTPHDPEMAPERIGTLMNGAMEIVARDAERNGATGFGILWEDARYPFESPRPFGLTVARVNPAGFITDTRAEKFLGGVARSPLHRSIVESVHGDGWHPRTPEIEAATHYLARYGDARWVRTGTWEDLRADHRHRMPALLPDSHAVPVACDAWGLIGDNVRDLFTTPDGSAMSRGFGQQVLHLRTPEFVLHVLDIVAAEDRGPTFGARWLCSFGVRLARLWTYAQLFDISGDLRLRERLRSRLAWARADLSVPLAEIRELALPGTPRAPKMVLGEYSDGSPREDPDVIQAFINWVGAHVIGDRHMLHRAVFEGAVSDAQVLEAALGEIVPEVDFTVETTAALRRAATMLMRAVMDAPSRPNASDALVAHLASSFALDCTTSTSPDQLMRMIEQIPAEVLLDEYTRAVPQALDIAVAPPNLDRGTDPYVFPAGALAVLRRRVLSQRTLGNHPGIYIRNNGEYGITLLTDDIVGAFRPLSDSEVILETSVTGVLSHILTTWEELGSR